MVFILYTTVPLVYVCVHEGTVVIALKSNSHLWHTNSCGDRFLRTMNDSSIRPAPQQKLKPSSRGGTSRPVQERGCNVQENGVRVGVQASTVLLTVVSAPIWAFFSLT